MVPCVMGAEERSRACGRGRARDGTDWSGRLERERERSKGDKWGRSGECAAQRLWGAWDTRILALILLSACQQQLPPAQGTRFPNAAASRNTGSLLFCCMALVDRRGRGLIAGICRVAGSGEREQRPKSGTARGEGKRGGRRAQKKGRGDTNGRLLTVQSARRTGLRRLALCARLVSRADGDPHVVFLYQIPSPAAESETRGSHICKAYGCFRQHHRGRCI